MSRSKQLALPIAKRLDKLIPLPHTSHWKVHKADVLQRGVVVTYLRTKSTFFLLPDAISPLKNRHVTITRHGFMVIYDSEERGLIVDLRDAFNVFCSTDKGTRFDGDFTRCHIKIRLPRGNIHLFVRDEEIHKWTCAIMRATSSKSRGSSAPAPIFTSTPVKEPELELNPSELALDDTQEEYDEEEAELDVTQELEELTLSIVTVIEREEERPSTVSVRSLREKLEKSLTMKSKEEVLAEQKQKLEERTPQFVKLFEKEDVADDVEEKDVENMRKEWWMRSLRC